MARSFNVDDDIRMQGSRMQGLHLGLGLGSMLRLRGRVAIGIRGRGRGRPTNRNPAGGRSMNGVKMWVGGAVRGQADRPRLWSGLGSRLDLILNH